MLQTQHSCVVEKKYWNLIREMRPTQRIAKAERMIDDVRKMLETQIRDQNPSLDERALLSRSKIMPEMTGWSAAQYF